MGNSFIKGQLRVWHIPQVPGKPFHAEVKTVFEAITIINLLANYDEFQFKHRIKPDYSNVSGLEEFDGEEWVEWENHEGQSIDEVIENWNEAEAIIADKF